MKTYTLHLAGLQRQLPLVDISENMAYASFVCISDTELVKAAAPLLAEKIKDCDIVLTAEAKGIALAYEVSKCLGHPCFAVTSSRGRRVIPIMRSPKTRIDPFFAF